MAGGVSVGGATPWWQLPGTVGGTAGGAQLAKLTGAAPNGYQYDPVTMGYTRNVDSAPNADRLQARKEGIQDIGNTQEQGLYSRLTDAMSGLQQSVNSIGQSAPGTGPTTGSQIPAQISYPTSSSGSPAPAVPATVSYGGSAGGDGGVQAAATAAQSAALGKAKATAGSLGRSSMNSLRADLAERGILGSGVEGRGLVRSLGEATNPLSDINAANLHEDVGISQHNQDLAAARTANEYSGQVAQRGQDIAASTAAANNALSRENSQFAGGISQRGQDITANTAAADNALARESLAQQKSLSLQSLLNSALSGLTGKLNVGLSY